MVMKQDGSVINSRETQGRDTKLRVVWEGLSY